MARARFTYVTAPTPRGPTKIDVLKDGRVIGRILEEDLIFRFHTGHSSATLDAAARFVDLQALKKWIQDTQ